MKVALPPHSRFLAPLASCVHNDLNVVESPSILGSTPAVAAIAQLGERQTEDLKVPGSIPGLGITFCSACSLNSAWRVFFLW